MTEAVPRRASRLFRYSSCDFLNVPLSAVREQLPTAVAPDVCGIRTPRHWSCAKSDNHRRPRRVVECPFPRATRHVTVPFLGAVADEGGH